MDLYMIYFSNKNFPNKNNSLYMYIILLLAYKWSNWKNILEQYQLRIQIKKSILGRLVKYVRLFTDSWRGPESRNYAQIHYLAPMTLYLGTSIFVTTIHQESSLHYHTDRLQIQVLVSCIWLMKFRS